MGENIWTWLADRWSDLDAAEILMNEEELPSRDIALNKIRELLVAMGDDIEQVGKEVSKRMAIEAAIRNGQFQG